MEVTSLGFKKPADGEFYDIQTVNQNTQLANDLIEENSSAIGHIQTQLDDITLYVSITGNDTTGDGSQAKPYRTINKTLSMLKKNIAANVKIRVLAGDYSSEGSITIKSFKGSSLTLTAFDGTNDVVSANDNYIIYGVVCVDTDTLFLQGFKTSTSTGYGIFCSVCKFVQITGYKNTTTGSSGVGVTGGSVVWIKDSTAQNLNTVISSNQGGVAISQNWIGTSNNGTGLVVNTGAKIHMFDDAQPVATNSLIQSNGGVIFDKNGNTISKLSSQQIFYQRDITLTGNFDIAINLSQPPSWIKVSACVNNTNMASEGNWSDGSEFCINTKNSGIKTGFYNIARFEDGVNIVELDVVSVAKNKITLSRTVTGTMSGTLYLTLLCGI